MSNEKRRYSPQIARTISTPESKPTVSQGEGLTNLRDFLLQSADFEALRQFELSLDPSKQFGKGHYQYYLGRLPSGGNPFYLNITPSTYIEKAPQKIVVSPHKAAVGENPYYWLDFYNGDEENLQEPFTSTRLQPENPSQKIDSRHWHSLEERLLADYLEGNNGITAHDLTPFYIELGENLPPYAIGGSTNFLMKFRGNTQIGDERQLLIVPNRDGANRYQWLDIYKPDREHNSMTRVSSYRLHPESHAIEGVKWTGVETQYYKDYIAGEQGLSFEELPSVRIRLAPKSSQVGFGTVDGKPKTLTVGSAETLGVDEVMLVPKQDPNKQYQWVEVYPIDKKTGKPTGQSIVSARLVPKEGFTRIGWLGAGKQSLVDYAQGTTEPSRVLPFTVKVGANPSMLEISSTKKQHLYVITSTMFRLVQNEDVLFIPMSGTDEAITFKLMRGTDELGTYQFVKASGKFVALEKRDLREKQPADMLVLYSQRTVSLDSVPPIELEVGSRPTMIDIAHESSQKQRIYITPSKRFGLQQGDKVVLHPHRETAEYVVFHFVTARGNYGIYHYYPASNKFRLIRVQSGTPPGQSRISTEDMEAYMFEQRQDHDELDRLFEQALQNVSGISAVRTEREVESKQPPASPKPQPQPEDDDYIGDIDFGDIL